MNLYVYADVLFFLNFCMDFLILYSIGVFYKKKPKKLRLLSGAVFAAGAYCFVGLSGLSKLMETLLGVLIISAGITITFFPFRKKEFVFYTLTAYAMSFILGGGCVAVYLMFSGGGFSLSSFPAVILAAAVVLSYILIKIVHGRIRKTVLSKQAVYEVKIALNGVEASFSGLVDTGCQLVEPVSGNPVIVSEFKAVRACLPESFIELFETESESNLEMVLESLKDSGLSDRIRMIPFRSVGSKNGMLIGFRPDSVYISEEPPNAERLEEGVIIGVYNGTLSSDRAYQALINPVIVSKIP